MHATGLATHPSRNDCARGLPTFSKMASWVESGPATQPKLKDCLLLMTTREASSTAAMPRREPFCSGRTRQYTRMLSAAPPSSMTAFRVMSRPRSFASATNGDHHSRRAVWLAVHRRAASSCAAPAWPATQVGAGSTGARGGHARHLGNPMGMVASGNRTHHAARDGMWQARGMTIPSALCAAARGRGQPARTLRAAARSSCCQLNRHWPIRHRARPAILITTRCDVASPAQRIE